jgi:hypothetical protein
VSEIEGPGPLESLILVRLLPSGDKGLKLAALQKDLAPLLEHRWSGNVLTSVLERSVLKLVARRQVCHLPTKTKKALPPFSLTEEGRRATLTLLGVSELPAKPKSTWATLKKSLLLGPALGLARSSIALSKDDNLRAVLLTQQFALPLGEFPTLKQARDEWLRKALGMGEREKVTLDTIYGALLRRELPETRPLAPKKALDRLLATKLSARRDDTKELRDAILRGWIERSLGEQVTDVSSWPSSPAAAATSPAPLDLPAFARTVLDAARATTTGRYSHNKVFIIHVWRSLQEHGGVQGMDLSAFKQCLAEANNARLLDLSRADLVQAMNPDDVQLSEVSYLSATFHFIRVE